MFTSFKLKVGLPEIFNRNAIKKGDMLRKRNIKYINQSQDVSNTYTTSDFM